MYTVLRISDGEHNFPFLYDGNDKIFWPDYGPRAYGKDNRFLLSWSSIPGAEPEGSCILDPRTALACVPIRWEGYNYYQCSVLSEVPGEGNYLELQALDSTGNVDPEFTVVQGIRNYTNTPNTTDFIRLYDPTRPNDISVNGLCMIIGSTYHIKNFLAKIYDPNHDELIYDYWNDEPHIDFQFEAALVGDEDIYWHTDQFNYITFPFGDYMPGGYTATVNFSLRGWCFKNNFEYIPGLKFIGIMKCTLHCKSGDLQIDFRTEPLPLTERLFDYYINKANRNNNVGIDPKNMKSENLRIIDKTVQNVVTMTSQTDSKANIIQPVFFRTRELTHILVHPEVTENIAINLDAYKSQVERFYIRLEGVSFPEIGRVEGGVIFKVQGSMLPGSKTSGTYYILNQDSDLVTTGKYTYES